MLSPVHRLALTAALAWPLATCAEPTSAASRGRGVLVIVVDGLRADHVSSAGYDRDTTPEIDALARDGVSFREAFTTAPWVLPAHVSLLTGCDPLIARRSLPPEVPPSVLTLWHVPERAPHFASELLRSGYRTAAFVDHGWIAPVHGLARGFQRFSTPSSEVIRTEQDVGISGVRRRFEPWLRQIDADESWFAYLEVDDLHRIWTSSDPAVDTYFEPREELATVPPVGAAPRIFFAAPRSRWPGGVRTLGECEARYDGAIRRVDHELGKLFDELRRLARFDSTTIVVTSGHGFGFGEAGLILDHGTLTDVDLHVPLIVKPAGGVLFERGLVTSALASLCDLAPTLLEIEHVAPSGAMHGVSLTDALRGGASRRAFAFARCGYQEGIAVIDERYCFESVSPWITEDRMLALSWYGGPPPPDKKQREVLHDRRADSALGHRASLALDDPRVVAMRQAGALHAETVERRRRGLHDVDWLGRERAPSPEPAR
jgi:arylsulfatase